MQCYGGIELHLLVLFQKGPMQVLVEGKTLPITAALRAFVEKQAQKLSHLGVKITQVRVFLENVARKTGEAHRSEVRYKVELAGKDIVVRRKGHDLYTAIVEATHRAKLQVVKLKQRHLDQRRTHLMPNAARSF